MVIRTSAVSGRPQIDPAAAVFDASQVVGNVHIDSGASVAPGATVRADGATPVFVGADTSLQEGVLVQAGATGRILGDDQQDYGVWIGPYTVLTPKVIVQGPVYVGANCFVGFRSTVMNARLGAGCIVMMHALVQDVEIPPGRFVSSGAIINDQDQADRLPNVQPADLAFAQEILGGRTLAFGKAPAGNAQTAPIWERSDQALNERDGLNTMQSQQLTPEIVQQVRQFLAQGYKIGTEHADSRRYRSNVWQTCSPIQSTHESEVLSALEGCLAEHAGEYVRMYGIDPKVKRRVAPVTIQRPDGKPVTASPSASPSGPSSSSAPSGGAAPRGGLSGEVVQQVRQMLAQGYRIGAEYADSRRYRSNVWQTCPPVKSNREGEVLASLERCLGEHAGDYVRIFGIDPNGKRRVATVTVQRPGKSTPSAPAAPAPAAAASQPSYANASQNGGHSSNGAGGTVSADLAQQVRQLVNQGYRVGLEHADARRYRSGAWQSGGAFEGSQSDVLSALQARLQEHSGEYVRLIGIDPRVKRRVLETTIQRP
ncbi:hypothetical protein C7271_21965 [filamentous cyanobacterium CCP5]|nr:hypothetical protein C7271_21965 [filamentous cyanobacterium CCP5]